MSRRNCTGCFPSVGSNHLIFSGLGCFHCTKTSRMLPINSRNCTALIILLTHGLRRSSFCAFADGGAEEVPRLPISASWHRSSSTVLQNCYDDGNPLCFKISSMPLPCFPTYPYCDVSGSGFFSPCRIQVCILQLVLNCSSN